VKLRLPSRTSLLLTVFLAALPVACRSTPKPAPAATSGNLQTFHLRGRVVAVHAADVTLDHEAIPGFMDAMTMSYKLADPSVASELHPGDRITADLLVRKDSDGFSDPHLDHIVVIAQARPDYKPAVQFHVPAPGDPVPDFSFLNQSGRIIHLDQFQGKALLVTFIYTRCPFADFCPRMSHNFADIDGALEKDPAAFNATHLLSISFDPSYDTPKVLRSYGAAATGRHAKETFSHWDFAAAPAKDLAAVTQFFNVGITDPDSPATLTHSLSTVLIGKDGRIVAWYPSNDWQPADVLQQLKKAAAA
jgi:protein SCO1/2